MKLFPKEINFFEIFDQMSENVRRGTTQLVDLFKNFNPGKIDEMAEEIYATEQKCDMITHDVIKKLNKTFLTPIDREDIHILATRMDDIMDLTWAVADRLKIYKIESIREDALEIARDLDRTVDVIDRAMKELHQKNYDHVQEHCIEINRLENRIDKHFKAALGNLFENETDPRMIIKWKDLYECLEKASNRCEDVANILESIVLKHA